MFCIRIWKVTAINGMCACVYVYISTMVSVNMLPGAKFTVRDEYPVYMSAAAGVE